METLTVHSEHSFDGNPLPMWVLAALERAFKGQFKPMVKRIAKS